jgi:hypothetical protein
MHGRVSAAALKISRDLIRRPLINGHFHAFRVNAGHDDFAEALRPATLLRRVANPSSRENTATTVCVGAQQHASRIKVGVWCNETMKPAPTFIIPPRPAIPSSG